MNVIQFAQAILTVALYVPISVESWGRTPEHNADVGGLPTATRPDELSYHLTWTAVDAFCISRKRHAIEAPKWKKRTIKACKRVGLQLVDEGDHWHIEPAVKGG